MIYGAGEDGGKNCRDGITIRQPLPLRLRSVDTKSKMMEIPRLVWEDQFCGRCAWVARTSSGHRQDIIRTSPGHRQDLFSQDILGAGYQDIMRLKLDPAGYVRQ